MPLDVLVTGRIATLAGDEGFGWVEALGISGGRVAFAGSEVDLETRADPHTRRLFLDPDDVGIPGLTDAHLHLADAAIAADQVDLTDATTIDEALAAIAARAATTPDPAAWIEGGGWDQRRLGRWPTAADLERAVPGRFVALWSFDHHVLWVSPAGLRAAGIDRSTTDPIGGIVRRAGDGEPEGVLLENAVALATAAIPAAAGGALDEAIVRLGRRLVALGVVAVHDPGGLAADGNLSGSFAAYERLADGGRLPIRVHAGLRAEALPTAIARGLRSGDAIGAAHGRARVGWLKLFADGTLGSGTAATLDPVGPGGGRGLFATPPGVLADLAAEAAGAGIATQVHAIGDDAVRCALDALEPTAPAVPFVPRVEHAQLIHPDDFARFARAGIAASVQPVHLREDAMTARREWGERAERDAYAWRKLSLTGALIPFGTDAPVEPIDPWPGLAIAAARSDPSWPPGTPPFGPDEALPLDRILRAACLDGPLTAGELDRGRLVPGQRADLIVVPGAAIRTPDPRALGTVRPRLVMMDGEVVFES